MIGIKGDTRSLDNSSYDMGVPKITGIILGASTDKDYSISGSILGSPHLNETTNILVKTYIALPS